MKYRALLLVAFTWMLAGCGGDKGPSGRDLVDFLNFEVETTLIEFTRAELESFPQSDESYSVRFTVTARLLEPLYQHYTPEPAEMAALLGDTRDEDRWADEQEIYERGGRVEIEALRALHARGLRHPGRPVILRETAALRAEERFRGRGSARRVGNRWAFHVEDESDWEVMGETFKSGSPRGEFPESAVIWGGRSERNRVQAAYREYRAEKAEFARIFRLELAAEEEREKARLQEIAAVRATVLSAFTVGSVLAGTLADPSEAEVGLALEITAFNEETLAGKALFRNDGGWSVSREVDFRLQIPTSAGSPTTLSVTLTPANAVEHGGALLAQTRGTLNFRRGDEGLWHFQAAQNQQFHLRVLDAAAAESLQQDWLAREETILEQFSEGRAFRGLYRWPGGSYTHEFLLTMASVDVTGQTVQATMESLTDSNLRRPLQGRVISHRYQAQGRPLRLGSARNRGMSGERDPLFGDQYALGWEFRADGTGWLVEFRDHDIRLEPADASWVRDLQTQREEALTSFTQATAVGAVYRGIWVRADDRRGFPVTMTVLRSEQGGRLYQVEFAHGDNPSDSMTFTGSLNADARTLVLNRDQRNSGSATPFVAAHYAVSFNLRWTDGNVLEGNSTSSSNAGRGNLRLEPDLAFSGARSSGALAGGGGGFVQAANEPARSTDGGMASSRDLPPADPTAAPLTHTPSPALSGSAGREGAATTGTGFPSASGAYVNFDGVWQGVDAVPFATRLHLPGQFNTNIGALMAFLNITNNAVSAELDRREVDFFFRGVLLPQEGVDPSLNVPHMAKLSPDRRGLQVELRRIAPGLAGILPEHRLPVTLDRIGTDGYRLRSARALTSGHYVILVGQTSYVFMVP